MQDGFVETYLVRVPLSTPGSVVAVICSGLVLVYVVYMRCMHPLAKYPGPIKASLTNVWKAYWVYKGIIHERLVQLHMQYGPVVRVGPNHLHIWSGDAISPIYKGGRMMGKTEFYDAFTAFNPNLFGGRDENIHALRRRQLSHGFSQASIEKLQPLIDGQMGILIQKLRGYAETGEVFDLKETISLYVLDILGDLAFSRSFGAQLTGEAEQIPAINDHLLLSCVIGELPCQNLLKTLARWSPVPWMRRLVHSRNNLKKICADCVKYKIAHPAERRDLLQCLVEAKDPETGASLTEQEINSEAFAMLVAGSHSTSGTLTLLLWHILHNKPIKDAVREEILNVLGPIPDDKIAYQVQGLEASLPYTMASVRENFRMNPVFTMPLWRRVHSPAGLQIGRFHIPHGTDICISNYVLHHNPDIWGPDHEDFIPDRWLRMTEESKARFLIPFSIGHRMCIGRNMGMTNVLKTVTTLLGVFELEPVSTEKKVRLKSSGIGEMEGTFLCRVSLRK
ncbi:cytochrome P450 [Aspergillus ambiguus]|uniref:cytochrome P450 n=1 Tax=Aspergillus ambiguus TaxID=176160 RepID=UPI003CCCA6FC